MLIIIDKPIKYRLIIKNPINYALKQCIIIFRDEFKIVYQEGNINVYF